MREDRKMREIHQGVRDLRGDEGAKISGGGRIVDFTGCCRECTIGISMYKYSRMNGCESTRISRGETSFFI